MDPNKQIDDIVAMLDAFMSANGGHMNIRVESDGSVRTEEAYSKTVTQMNSLDCAAGDLACQVPTLFEGLDEEPDSDADAEYPDSPESR